MASFSVPSLRTGNSQSDQNTQTRDYNLLKGEAPAASNNQFRRSLQPMSFSNIVLEGYTMFRADPLPPAMPTWYKVERTHMFANIDEMRQMVRERAFNISAAQQYQNLSRILQEHVNLLIHDRKIDDSDGVWSCVFAREEKKSSREYSPETVALDVILMRRPLGKNRYPTSPMGDLVDLRARHNMTPSSKIDTYDDENGGAEY